MLVSGLQFTVMKDSAAHLCKHSWEFKVIQNFYQQIFKSNSQDLFWFNRNCPAHQHVDWGDSDDFIF